MPGTDTHLCGFVLARVVVLQLAATCKARSLATYILAAGHFLIPLSFLLFELVGCPVGECGVWSKAKAAQAAVFVTGVLSSAPA